jgi:ATP-binding cassette subfamily B (MDR/TAP) protein 1
MGIWLTPRETDEVRMATSGSFGNLVQYSFTFLFCFILAMYRAPILALVTLSTIPGVVLIQIIAQILIGPMLDDERRAIAEASTNIERTTAAISTVKIHNAQTTEGDRFAPIVKKAKIALVKQARVWSVTTGSSETLLLSTFVLGFWYGAKLVREGKANPGDVMTVFWAALLAATYLQMVVEQLVVVTKGKTSMASLRTVIRDLPSRPTSSQYSPANTPSDSKFGHKVRPTSMRQIRPTRCHGEYNFQNVSFYYPSRPEQWVLRDVTLFLPPGETTFIVGGSGSGKSTVAQLLLRLYTPVGGEITLDDQSITYLDDEFTKEHIAAVQQGCILFDMSVHDNVAMGLAGAGVDSKTGIRKRPGDVARSEVEEACRMAMIHDFVVGLPDGYNTILGTGGNALSGGQRQRLAIARARIRDPTILVLGKFINSHAR